MPSAAPGETRQLDGTELTNGARLAPGDLFAVDALGPSEAQLGAWELGANMVRNECAAQLGYDNIVQIDHDDTTVRELRKVEQLYFDNADLIVRYGYEFPFHIGSPPNPDETVTTATTAVPLEAVDVPSEIIDKCNKPVDEVLRSLEVEYGPVPDLGRIDADIAAASLADVHLDDLRNQWKDCISAEGFPSADLATVWDPMNVPPIAQAEADFRCRQQVGFSSAKVAFVHQALAMWLEGNAEAAANIRKYWEAMSAAGARLLDG